MRPAPGGAVLPALVEQAGRPDVVTRRRPSVRRFSELALMVVLALTLGFTWRDGPASDGYVFATAPATSPSVAALGTGGELDWPGAFRTATSEIAAPRVPTARPVELLIPALDIHRPIEGVGVDRSGVLNLPVNFWNAGWYTGGPIPGAPGDAVIEGHAGYPGQPLIFGKLILLKPGSKIIVVLADGTRQLFLVDSMTSIPVGTAPADMGQPYGPPRLTLITCTGSFNKSSYSYSQRLVLEASYAGLA